MKKLIILHGFTGKPDEERKLRLKTEAEKLGYSVYLPQLVETMNPTLSAQLNQVLELYSDLLDEETIVLGHSVGAVLAKHLVISIGKKINKIICLAPVFQGIDWRKIAERKEKFRPALDNLEKYVNQTSVDYSKLNSLVNQHIVYISDDDYYVNLDDLKKYYLSKNIPNLEFKEFSGRNHFSASSGTKTIPELLGEL